ncbi:MdtA/MuxA family multidrug efflux RND transporter periplasmic adaptor subunit [Ferribacterium limneticum]|uniref:MdtA/MuxA family multidrug efflux RND transporter periplasmic adaptor subunit n=1 Tax=Ferribacterium limneticum TaxID=76259 RepID=UPI001CF9720B|nr:MdtA/MuxA family multidrug efflux RND transporter periplasmic adaptor subunit [Ferribacterium limneticum]UCV20111.1 MdtA/MuxA family multidrug efflux RND transporter periplasmic adaptor subunit [Ferribacterium limneticum]
MGITDKLKFKLNRRAGIIALLGSVLLIGGGSAAVYYTQGGDGQSATPGSGQRGPGGRRGDRAGNRPQPVKASEAKLGDLDIVVSALGTVTASNTATVKPRVDGQLIRINFREGQQVKSGDLLAEIDPRQYQIQLDQVSGQLTKDEALLAAARVDLERYRNLLSKDSIAKQQVDTQEALVRQYRGVVEADKAQVDNARLQLGFTRVTAPAAGRLGLRQVDVGNNVRAADATGLVVITQTQPINTVFAIPAESVGNVVNKIGKGETLAVEAWDRDGRTLLTTGKLLSVDNQIDVATGTVKLKAEFANKDNSLFPNQFVNIKLKVETRAASLLVNTAAVQRNAEGTFVYVINREEQTVDPRPVRLGPTNGEVVAVDSGLKVGDLVVVDGADRLRPGGKVDVLSTDGKSNADERKTDTGEGNQGGERRRRRDAGEEKASTASPAPQAGAEPSAAENPDRPRRARDESNGNTAGGAPTQTAQAAPEGERRGQRRCAPENIANDPEAAARCERFRKMREGGRRGE